MFDWERSWRGAGVLAVGLIIVAYIVYGSQPGVGASAGDLVSFYHGNSTRILIAGFIFGFGVLNLLWFGAALSSVIRDAGQGTWATAATASSAALGATLWLQVGLRASLAYSIAGSGNGQLTSGLNDLSWAVAAISSFSAAMLIMSGSFGLWRAGIISTAFFGPAFAAIWLELAGATTWVSGGIWAPDGAYTRYIAPLLLLVWAAVFSGRLVMLSPSTATTARPGRAAVSGS
jgi:hypothetical protein